MNEPNLRGVSVVTFGDKQVTLKASFSALTNIEATLNRDLLSLAKDVASHKLSLMTLSVCLFELSKAGGHRFTLRECGDMVLGIGMVKAAAPIMMSLGGAITAGQAEATVGAEEGSDPS